MNINIIVKNIKPSDGSPSSNNEFIIISALRKHPKIKNMIIPTTKVIILNSNIVFISLTKK